MSGDIGIRRVRRVGLGDPVFGDKFGKLPAQTVRGKHLPPAPPQCQSQIEQQLAIAVRPAEWLALDPHLQRLGIVETLQGMATCAELLESRFLDMDTRLRRAARILANKFADLPLAERSTADRAPRRAPPDRNPGRAGRPSSRFQRLIAGSCWIARLFASATGVSSAI